MNRPIQMLKFGKGNAKLGKDIYTFSLPAGYTCPFARECLSKADRTTGKITDGRHTKFRCFSATLESVYKETRAARWHNLDLLKTKRTPKTMAALISDSLPKRAMIVRIHVGGDFYNARYFDAWTIVARQHPKRLFYAYTKSLSYWLAYTEEEPLPPNFILTASKGGKRDNLIQVGGFRTAEVVFSKKEAKTRGLKIDHDDSHAMRQGPSFALLLHGVQPKGSPAGEAMKVLRASGQGGYS